MGDRVEALPRGLVGEHAACERLSIEVTAGVDDRRAEGVDDLGERRGRRFDDPPRELVRVDIELIETP
jgi:hypothetical protein